MSTAGTPSTLLVHPIPDGPNAPGDGRILHDDADEAIIRR